MARIDRIKGIRRGRVADGERERRRDESKCGRLYVIWT